MSEKDGGRLVPENVIAEWVAKGLIPPLDGTSDLPWDAGTSQATRNGAQGRRCRRHEFPKTIAGGFAPWPATCVNCMLTTEDPDAFFFPATFDDEMIPEYARCVFRVRHSLGFRCLHCRTVRDPVASRRGLSARRLGGDQERRIERRYGPRKVGEYGDPVDHLGRDFKWQAKSTRSLPPKWLAAITAPTWRATLPKAILDPMAHMTGIGGTRRPLVIRSYVHHGVATRDWLFIPAIPWLALHGDPLVEWEPGYMVIPGADFLELHGRDEE